MAAVVLSAAASDVDKKTFRVRHRTFLGCLHDTVGIA
jgi:hypothetical protein